MKFDNIIIGGGLAGLTAAIKLTQAGKKTAVISSGQSALHFCSGSLCLLGRVNGATVTDPIAEIQNLPAAHPYQKIGTAKVADYAENAATILKNAKIGITGSHLKNHYTLTPFGKTKVSWLTLSDFHMFNDINDCGFTKALIVNLKDFLEFYPSFIAQNLEKRGVETRLETVEISKINQLRDSKFDMRAVSISKQIDEQAIREFAKQINSIAIPGEMVIVPAIFGVNSPIQFQKLRELVHNEIMAIATIPVSVVGVRMQNMLQRYYERIGGTFFLGDKVTGGKIEDGRVQWIETANLGDDRLVADDYILATGSLLSEGIKSTPTTFYEPIFGLDIAVPESRSEWYAANFFAPQPYMNFGIATDSDFHPSLSGVQIKNLYVCGATLSDCNPLEEASGAGISMITSLHVANTISNKQNESL